MESYFFMGWVSLYFQNIHIVQTIYTSPIKISMEFFTEMEIKVICKKKTSKSQSRLEKEQNWIHPTS